MATQPSRRPNRLLLHTWFYGSAAAAPCLSEGTASAEDGPYMRGFARAASVAGVYAERLYARIYGVDTLLRRAGPSTAAPHVHSARAPPPVPRAPPPPAQRVTVTIPPPRRLGPPPRWVPRDEVVSPTAANLRAHEAHRAAEGAAAWEAARRPDGKSPRGGVRGAKGRSPKGALQRGEEKGGKGDDDARAAEKKRHRLSVFENFTHASG